MKFASKIIAAIIATATFTFAECDSNNCSPQDFSVQNPVIKEMKVGENGSAVNTAGYMTFKNPFSYPVTINSVVFTDERMAIGERIELHTHKMNDNVAKMEKVDAFEVPAKGEITLKPGADHIMFIGLDKSMTAGEKVQLTLNISWNTTETKGSESKNITFDIMSLEKIAAMCKTSTTETKKCCGCKGKKKNKKESQ